MARTPWGSSSDREHAEILAATTDPQAISKREIREAIAGAYFDRMTDAEIVAAIREAGLPVVLLTPELESPITSSRSASSTGSTATG